MFPQVFKKSSEGNPVSLNNPVLFSSSHLRQYTDCSVLEIHFSRILHHPSLRPLG